MQGERVHFAATAMVAPIRTTIGCYSAVSGDERAKRMREERVRGNTVEHGGIETVLDQVNCEDCIRLWTGDGPYAPGRS